MLARETEAPDEQGPMQAQTQRLADIGTLAASVAHELNNPISIITAACTSLQAQLDDENLVPESLRRQLAVIEQSAWRCARLIQALRSYAHPDAQPLPSDLNALIENGLALVSYQYERQDNITVRTVLAPELPQVVWEPNQITQVLINLLSNARDALQPAGGRITVRSWQTERHGGTRLYFSVEDTGKGIPPDILPFIFRPFFTTKRAGEGTGLGLAIASDIVARHQGKIWADTLPGGGARFTVELPCRPDWQEKEPDLVRPAP
ncbi:MAG: ATP-binding protein [Anaerolineae bacterium]|nr:ATP-binding protein [Anaerolineae bacterium]